MAGLPALERFYLGSVRHAVSTGETLDPETIEAFRLSFGLTIHDGYGQTENTLLVANVPGTEIRPGSMGLPTPGHDVAVIDEEGNEQPVRVEGDLALRGKPPSLFHGYWDAPDETRAAFRGEWYLTGDRATRDEDGYLWFTGRAETMILASTSSVTPLEVESAVIAAELAVDDEQSEETPPAEVSQHGPDGHHNEAEVTGKDAAEQLRREEADARRAAEARTLDDAVEPAAAELSADPPSAPGDVDDEGFSGPELIERLRAYGQGEGPKSSGPPGE